SVYSSFFFDATSSTATYTLSLHDALPICSSSFFIYAGPLRPAFLSQLKSDGFIKVSLPCHINDAKGLHNAPRYTFLPGLLTLFRDRKSTRLNSSHVKISYAVFCLKKKKKI